jgi:hypothetical protein
VTALRYHRKGQAGSTAWLLRRSSLMLAADFSGAVTSSPCAAGHGHAAGSQARCGGCRQARQDISTLAVLARERT